jgi:Molybdopterin converting factor, large subunit
MSKIEVTHDPIKAGQAYEDFCRANHGAGGVGMFVGRVRGSKGDILELEHYPGMTEKSLKLIAEDATKRFELIDVVIKHRVGPMSPGEDIVLVLAAAAHRHQAIHAVDFMMDYLKTNAPFWKRQTIDGVNSWVDARTSDRDAARRWD